MPASPGLPAGIIDRFPSAALAFHSSTLGVAERSQLALLVSASSEIFTKFDYAVASLKQCLQNSMRLYEQHVTEGPPCDFTTCITPRSVSLIQRSGRQVERFILQRLAVAHMHLTREEVRTSQQFVGLIRLGGMYNRMHACMHGRLHTIQTGRSEVWAGRRHGLGVCFTQRASCTQVHNNRLHCRRCRCTEDMGNFPSAVAAPVVRTLRGDTAPNDHDGTSDRQTPYNVAASEAAGSVTGSSSDSPAPGDDDSNGTSGHPPLVLHAIPAATVEVSVRSLARPA